MKNCIGVLFVFLFFVSSFYFVSAAAECSDSQFMDSNCICQPDYSYKILPENDNYYSCVLNFNGASLGSWVNCYDQGNCDSSTAIINYCYMNYGHFETPIPNNCLPATPSIINPPIVNPSNYSSCSDDQTIIRLYRENNSHVSSYSDSNYPIRICYANLFGYSYTGANPHSCNANNSNLLFWLNSSKNSHISAANSPQFNIPVCYGNLDCSFESSCNYNTSVLLLKVSDVENAHVSTGQDGNYDFSICCKNSLSLSSSFWSNLKGEEINRARLGDTVLMVAKGFEFEDSALNYTVINTASGTKWYGGVVSWFNQVFRGWEAPEKWMQTNTNVWVTSDIGEFKFTVNILGTNITASSFSNLIVTDEKSGVNTKPFVNITSNRTVYTLVNTNVSFNSTVYDKEDFLTVVWDYSDGSPLVKSHYSLATEDKSYLDSVHSFSKPGHYIVKLTATEEGSQRAQSSSDFVEVFVYGEGVNVMSIVSSPIDGKNDYGRVITFDASQSYIVNCSTSAFREGYDLIIHELGLNCKYIQAPNQAKVGDSYSIDVSWLIDGTKVEQGAWGSEVSAGTIQNFLRYFPLGKHTAQLSLTFNSK